MSGVDPLDSDHRDVLADLWENLHEADREYVQKIVLKSVDRQCKEQINAGQYDSSVALRELFDEFREAFVSGGDNDITYAFPGQIETGTAARLAFQRVIDRLVDRDVLLYVYDKQRVRSRVAEITRYFALLRQRFPEQGDFEYAPSLSKMVKMDIQPREKPKWGEDGVPIDRVIRRLISGLQTADPAPELVSGAGSTAGWHNATREALHLIHALCRSKLSEADETYGLAKFQGRSFETLFKQAVTDTNDGAARVITASTGGGKTEAFLFPILGYTLTTSAAAVHGDGVDAVLAYPRKDLCNNQFERIVEYLYKIQTIIEYDTENSYEYDTLSVTVALQHSSADDAEIDCPEEGCPGRMTTEEMTCSEDESHTVGFTTVSKRASADILVTTPDTLHRRLMDHRGTNQFWARKLPPKFIVLDEVHVYTNQYGMHVANVMRRFRQAMQQVAPEQHPCLVASSATISNAEDFTRRIYGVDRAYEITPREDETEDIGWEYLIFVKATDPREVKVPRGEAKYLPQREWAEGDYQETNVTNLSSMIQVAFSMYHTILKEEQADAPDKNKVLGFVDSIDSVKRLGDYIQSAESGHGVEGQELFSLRSPDAILYGADEDGDNPACPKSQFQGAAADHEQALCEPLPPNKHLNPCPVYEAGECWWTMTDYLDLEPMDVYLHKSGRTEHPDGSPATGDDWDLMVTTSALEVGFDHPGIIGTFQYRAPMNIPGFVQRKGRGGRDPDDQPVSVVVLGSRPEDSFYFHHNELLSDPDDQYLEINLDEQNDFIRTEHMISAIFDYINLTDSDTADRIYRRLDIPALEEILEFEREEIQQWISEAFQVSEPVAADAVSKITGYVQDLKKPLAGEDAGEDDKTPFWEAARIEANTNQAEFQQELRNLRTERNILERIASGQLRRNDE